MKGLVLILVPLAAFAVGYLAGARTARRRGKEIARYRALLTGIQRGAAQHIALGMGDTYAPIVFDEIDTELNQRTEKA